MQAGCACRNLGFHNCPGGVIDYGICQYPGGPHPVEDQSGRGWIINNTKQAISVEAIDYEGRVLKDTKLFSGQVLRVSRLFDTVTQLKVNGQLFDRCFVLGMESDVKLSNRTQNAILVSLDNSFPYLRCTSLADSHRYRKYRYNFRY